MRYIKFKYIFLVVIIINSASLKSAISISPDKVNVGANAGEYKLQVTDGISFSEYLLNGSTEWVVDGKSSWLSLSTLSGAGNEEITVEYTDNTTGQPRLGSILINEIVHEVYQDSDIHGDSQAEATRILPNSTTAGNFSGSGDFDWFYFDLEESAFVTIGATQNTVTDSYRPVAGLEDRMGNEFRAGRIATADGRIKKVLNPGTYYLSFYSNSVGGTYLLELDVHPITRSDISFTESVGNASLGVYRDRLFVAVGEKLTYMYRGPAAGYYRPIEISTFDTEFIGGEIDARGQFQVMTRYEYEAGQYSYSIWNFTNEGRWLDSQSLESYELLDFESKYRQDFNGDGVIGDSSAGVAAPTVDEIKSILPGKEVMGYTFLSGTRFRWNDHSGNWTYTKLSETRGVLIFTYDRDGNNSNIYYEEALLFFSSEKGGDYFYREVAFGDEVTQEQGVFDISGQLKPWYQGAIDLGGSWRWLDWFESFNVTSAPWIYHAEHGWQYVIADSPDSLFIWDVGMESFLWTSDTVYPTMFRLSDGKWIYYLKGSQNPRHIVDLATGIWEQW